MHDEEDVLGVSAFLPPVAAAGLVRAAHEARKHERHSIERVRVLDRAVRKVKAEYPEYFVDAPNSGRQRPRADDRRGSRER